jgi:[protein-PII] uridylyltransferase
VAPNAALDASTVEDEPGVAWCRTWTRRIDSAVQRWLAELAPDRAVSVVALGGYARRELCPASDIDLLILHDGWPAGSLEELVRALCYPLWDAGLSVGHAVRTLKEAVAAASERIDTATALTDRRFIAGDPGLAAGLGSMVARWLRRNGGTVLSDLAAADDARHVTAGLHPGLLEPDLKSGAGGLRDLHSLRWAAACVLGEVGLDPLVGARYVSAIDRRDLAEAGETLLAARCALHLVQGRAARDVLRLDLQDEVAARLGLADGDELLRRVGLAARTIAHVHGRAWTPLLTDAREGRRRRHPDPVPLDDGIALVDGLVEVTPERTLDDEPDVALRAVAAAARRHCHLGRGTAERFARALPERGPLPWSDRTRTALLETLHEGRRAMPALADADHIGLLDAYLPEWSRVRGRPQRNPFHRFDLDTHGIQAVCELVAIAEGGDGPARAAVWEGLEDHGVLLLGTLLHDIGKAWPGDHSIVGAEIAPRWIRHMGFADTRAETVGRLVRHHLLLPDVATRRDIDDPDEVAAVARSIGDPQLLDALYLLTLADSRATGPSAHSPWKDGLIADLHARVRAELAADPHALSAAFDPGLAADEARRHATGTPAPEAPAELERLLEGLPPRYVVAATPEQCAAHAALLRSLPEPGELRAAWRAGPADGTATLSVVAADRRGLVADCTGVLAGHGVRVLDARAFTRRVAGELDVAVDWFVVADDGDLPRERIVADLRDTDGRGQDVQDLVARRERQRDVRPPALAAPVEVSVRIDVGEETTRIEVHGPDAPGVLSRLAGELARSGLDLVGARVATLGPEVRDVFFVTTPDPEQVIWEELRARLRHAAGWRAQAPGSDRTARGDYG